MSVENVVFLAYAASHEVGKVSEKGEVGGKSAEIFGWRGLFSAERMNRSGGEPG